MNRKLEPPRIGEERRPSARPGEAERGVAMILVLAVLMALVVLAVPMLNMATRENQASVMPLARAEARAVTEGMLRYARFRLLAGHKEEERLREAGGLVAGDGSGAGRTPTVDTEDESYVAPDILDSKGQPATDAEGRPLLARRSQRGTIADIRVRDEQAFPNLMSAPPFLVAASLARTTLSGDITEQDVEVQVEEASGFPAKNGALNIEGEVITYAELKDGRFVGCQRGAAGGTRARRHRADVDVLDDRAREIAMLPFRSPRAKGGFREPAIPTYVKEISFFGRDALSALEVDRLCDEFSIFGRREAAGGFGEKTSVRGPIDPSQDSGQGFPVQVTSGEGMNPGTIVRISDGINIDYGIVIRNRGRGGPFGGGFGTIVLAEAPQNAYEQGRTYVQPLLRHPVNINAAPRAVLYRLIEGIQLAGFGGGGGPFGASRVGEEAAAIVVEGILASRPIKDFKHFRELLEDWVEANKIIFTAIQAEAIFRNAIDPNDAALATSTVPFCFESYDFYTLEGSAVVNDQSGRELARRMVREFVHVAPSGRLTHTIDTQAEFEESLTRARAGKYVTTFPWSVERWTSATAVPSSRVPRMLFGFGGAAVPGMPSAAPANEEKQEESESQFARGVFPSKEEGHLTLLPARMEGTGYLKHFDGPTGGFFPLPDPGVDLRKIDPNGWKLSAGPYRIDPRDQSGGFGGGGQTMVVRERGVQGNPQVSGTVTVTVAAGEGGGGRGPGGGRGSTQGQGSLMGRTTPNPVRFDTWWYTGSSGSGRAPIFDFVADGTEEDRVSLTRESDGSLVARVSDRTIDDPTDGFEETLVTRWAPESGGFWKAQTWYHVGLAYRGTKPEDLTLFVDGYKRGESRFKTALTGAFDDDDTNFSVENAEGWPNRGVAMVGTEVIAFERTGESFDVIQFQGRNWGRGQRGTRIRRHQSGEPVVLFGYSGLPRTNNSNSGIVIPRGGGTLRDSLSHWCVATFDHNDTVTINMAGGQGGIPIPIRIDVHDPAKPNGSILALANTSLGVPDYDAFPASGGYILIVSRPTGLPGGPEGGIEFARYESRSGNRLYGLTSVSSPPNKSLANLVGAAIGTNGPQFSLTRRLHPVRISAGTSAVQNVNTLSAVFPVSIALSDVAGYREPERDQESNQNQAAPPAGSGLNAAAMPWDTVPEFIQVGTPDPTALERNQIEWVRYHHVDTERGHLLCDEARYLLSTADVLRLYYLGNPQGIAGSQQLLEATFPFRRQCGTNDLSDGRVTANSEAVPCIRTESASSLLAVNIANLNAQNLDAPVTGEAWSFAGHGDAVTVEGQNARDRKLTHVAWAGLDKRQLVFQVNGQQLDLRWLQQNYDGQGWVAFTESLNLEYRQRTLPRDGRTNFRPNYVRLLKFPSGELPNMGQGARAFAGGNAEREVASSDGYVDEVRVTPFSSRRYVLWNHEEMDFAAPAATSGQVVQAGKTGIDATTDEIPLANVEWLVSVPRNPSADPRYYMLPDGRQILYEQELQGLPRNDAGLVKIGEEIIAFRGLGQGQGGAPALLDCVRGFMNSVPVPHGFGEEVVFLDFLGVSMLSGAIDARASDLPVAQVGGFVQNGGTVLVGDEMIHYTEMVGRGLSMPYALDSAGNVQGGLFRGRYGTTPRSHDAQSVVLEMPFRYWDRYAPMQDSGEMAYYGFSMDLPGAYFESLRVEKMRPVELVDVEVLCRTDPEIRWDADPGRTPGLFLFGDLSDKEASVIRRAGRGLDVRVLFKFLPGAFQPDLLTAHDWKATPEVRSIRVDYLDETRVLGREDLR